MLWAEKRLVSAKDSSSCKHFICSIATWINTWNSIGFTLKSDWRHLFSSSLYSISILPPLLYSFAVDVERQLSVESIFHRFRFHLKEICKGLTILQQDSPCENSLRSLTTTTQDISLWRENSRVKIAFQHFTRVNI